jgi:hypothetical protein
MDSSLFLLIIAANIGCVYGGYCFLKGFCHEEEREFREHRRMTELEIRMLSKKIEKVSG